MSHPSQEWQAAARIHRIRRIRTLALIVLAATAAILAPTQVLAGDPTLRPFYVPTIVTTAIVMALAAMLLTIHFRRLEIQSTTSEGDRYLLVQRSMKQSLLFIAITGALAAILFVPILHDAVIGGMSQTTHWRIAPGGAETLEGGVPSVDSLGVSRTTALTVSVSAGRALVSIMHAQQPVQENYVEARNPPWSVVLDTSTRRVYDIIITNPLTSGSDAEVSLTVVRDLFPEMFTVVPFALGLFAAANVGWYWWWLRPLSEQYRRAAPRRRDEERERVDEEPESPVPTQPRFLNLPPPRPTELPPPGESVSGPAILVRVAPSQRPPRPPSAVPPPPPPAETVLRGDAARLEADGSLEEALTTYDALLRRSPLDRNAALGKAGVLQKLGRRPAALGVYRQLLQVNRTDIDALRGCLAIHEADGSWRDALDAVDRIAALTPEDADAHARRGDILSALRMPDGARAAYERALALRPGDPELETRARAAAVDIPGLISGALVSSAAGDFQAAVDAFDEVLRFEPENLNALVGKGVALRRLGHREEALGLIEDVLARNSLHGGALLTKAQMLAETGDLPGSLAALESLLAAHPEDAEALVERGDVLAALGHPDAARESYEAALRLKPGDRDATGKLRTLLEGAKPEPAVILALFRVRGLGPAKVSALVAAGFRTVEDFRRATVEQLASVEGISRKLAEDILGRFTESRPTARDD